LCGADLDHFFRRIKPDTHGLEIIDKTLETRGDKIIRGAAAIKTALCIMPDDLVKTDPRITLIVCEFEQVLKFTIL
jgi:hypothetical protein